MNASVWVLLGVGLVATAAFIWLANGVLTALSWPIAKLGASFRPHATPRATSEQDSWLFALLIAVTRPVILAMAGACFGLKVAATVGVLPGFIETLSGSIFSLMLIVLAMRLGAIFIASLMLGGSVRNVLKTLKG